MDQEVKPIKIKDLVLWTENPRDPIDANAKDQDIVDRALGAEASKWNLTKLARAMGKHYDFSELPTVVYHNEKPIVYDGNRRIILGKIKHGLVKSSDFNVGIIPDVFPEDIPCNVCVEQIALENVYRKHADSGSWDPLERDMFLHKFMGHPKSSFLLIEESTGLIGANKHLNKGFVKDEVFKKENLTKIGFRVEGENLLTVHSNIEAKTILGDISKKVEDKVITTRESRGDILAVLEPESKKIIKANIGRKLRHANLSFNERRDGQTKGVLRLTSRTKENGHILFGKKLLLKFGDVNDLYCDITKLYSYYEADLKSEKKNFSPAFPGLIRMSLRLLCERAAEDASIDDYIKKYYHDGKSGLSSEDKTFLSTQVVNDSSLVRLLHIGAHSYSASKNIQQTLAISIILGEMLTKSHGKQ
jgi:hypothetical protein